MAPVPDVQIQIWQGTHVSGNPELEESPSYKEFITQENLESTTGISTHHTILLRPHRLLSIYVFVPSTFDWGKANAIRLLIDFDTGHEVRGLEQLILKEDIKSVTTAPSFAVCNEGYQIKLDRLIRQLGNGYEEEFSFTTQYITQDNSEEGCQPRSEQGTIAVKFETCKVLASKRGREPHSSELRPIPKRFKSNDILTHVVLCQQSNPRPTLRHDFSDRSILDYGTKNSREGIFYFHYYDSQVWHRIVAQERAKDTSPEPHDLNRKKPSLANQLLPTSKTGSFVELRESEAPTISPITDEGSTIEVTTRKPTGSLPPTDQVGDVDYLDKDSENSEIEFPDASMSSDDDENITEVDSAWSKADAETHLDTLTSDQLFGLLEQAKAQEFQRRQQYAVSAEQEDRIIKAHNVNLTELQDRREAARHRFEAHVARFKAEQAAVQAEIQDYENEILKLKRQEAEQTEQLRLRKRKSASLYESLRKRVDTGMKEIQKFDDVEKAVSEFERQANPQEV